MAQGSSMPLYFLVLDADFFHRQAAPALTASWEQRSFTPCRALGDSLKSAAAAFAERFHTGAEEPVLARLADGFPFDRDIWRLLAGEVLLYGARDIPEIPTAPNTLGCLLAPEQYLRGSMSRPGLAPIYQAHFGTRDVVFGRAFYRPDAAGLNDVADVARLADFLDSIDPGAWTAHDLSELRGIADEDERREELELARDWFPLLQQLYRGNRGENRVIVCEVLGEAASE
jgi:hypothetical protein